MRKVIILCLMALMNIVVFSQEFHTTDNVVYKK